MTKKYSVSFTLSQDSLESPVVSSLQFTTLSTDDVNPLCYDQMGWLVQQWMFATGMTDEKGNLIDDDKEPEAEVTARLN